MSITKALIDIIYTSWTEYTFEFYESPTPWGPWKLFLSKDFGTYPWSNFKYGGYATVIPSKYISEDGTEMWVNSQTFMSGIKNYKYSLRKLKVTPYFETNPENAKGDENLALPEFGQDSTPISRSSHYGINNIINNGKTHESEDSWNNEVKQEDYWGYTWSHAYNINQVVYTTGEIHENGGWFKDLNVQVRQNFEWVDVKSLEILPEYTFDDNIGFNTAYTITFNDNWGDGIRIIGSPGGEASFTSIAELEVYYK